MRDGAAFLVKVFGRFCLRRLGIRPTRSGSTLTKALSASWNVNGWSETGLALGIMIVLCAA